MKIRIQMDEEIDLKDLWSDYDCVSANRLLESEIVEMVRDEIRKQIVAAAKGDMERFVKEVLGGKIQINEKGEVFIPLLWEQV